MKTMIAYKKQSCVTGKLLRTIMSIRRKTSSRRAKVDAFIRWGNSDPMPVRAKVELNTSEAVARTTNKLSMIQTLAAANLPTLEFTTDSSVAETFKDDQGKYYIRSKLGVVRYDSDFNPVSDAYASKPVPNKRREYRVHVFNSKIIAIYEKVPLDQETRPALFKSFNCKFRKVDPAISLCDSVGQQIAIDAVNSLGLLFGGVDLIRDKDKKFTVCEVNSAPGLNETNAQRWVTAITEYINERIESDSGN
jgi:glutathione synthase/RimK-type ligase-like ATP-grasp enzyme